MEIGTHQAIHPSTRAQGR